MKVGITFGALAEPLSKQLSGYGISSIKIAQFQRDADAITRLSILGLLPDGQTRNARKRLLKNIIKAVK